MGMNANATIFFGYDLGEYTPEVDIDDLVREMTKAEHDAVDWDSRPEYDSAKFNYSYSGPEYGEYRKAYEAWTARTVDSRGLWRAARIDAEREIGVTFGWYGSLDGFAQHYLAAYGSAVDGDWGEPVELPIDLFTSSPVTEYTKKLALFVQKYEIETVNEDPKWLMVVSYG